MVNSFRKDKVTGKWYCSDCGKEIPEDEVITVYDYFGENKEHICRQSNNE